MLTIFKKDAIELLVYILNATTGFILEFTLAVIDPKLLKFLEQRGEFTASNGVKIMPGEVLELGPADSTTGYPRYIKGIGNGLTQARNKGSTLFSSHEARARYSYGLRMALVDLVNTYKLRVDGHKFSLPYVVTLG